MKNSDSNYLKMEMAIKDFLEQNPSITGRFEQYTSLMADLSGSIQRILLFGETQLADKRGVTLSKKQLRADLVEMAHETISKLCSYALSENNQALFRETYISNSKLKQSPDNVLKEHTQLVCDKASANIESLAPFGITGDDVNSLQIAIDRFVNYIPKPRLSSAERKQATLQMQVENKNIRKTIKKLDLLAEALRYSEPNFYNGYKICRKIVNTSTRSLSLKGKVVDALTGEPIKSVGLILTHIDGTTVIRKKSFDQGGFLIKTMPEGKYKITAKAVGYSDAEVEVFISDSKLYNLNIELQKL